MVNFRSLITSTEGARRRTGEEFENLLPHHRVADGVHSGIPAKRVTKVALRLKHLVESTVPCELKESQITRPHSEIITRQVILLAREAGGVEDRACVVFGLLTCIRWFKRQATLELYDADLNLLRAEAAQVIASELIGDAEVDQDFLFQEILLKRFSIIKNGEESSPVSALEKAVDLHATRVVGSSGFQKCVNYLWCGWVVQDLEDPMKFVHYHNAGNKSFWAHFDHDRIRAPRYQNAFQVMISVLYLIFYTISVNTVSARGGIDVEEGVLYLFTLSFIADELTKLWKVGRFYINFWNVFNMTLYVLVSFSFFLRMVALAYPPESDERVSYNLLSYNFLAFVSPLVWSRMLLFLDSIRFFGAMLVVLKVMMMESLIFFALLVVVILGFMQGFIGLDAADTVREDTFFVLSAMAKAILGSPEFDGFEDFGHPFGLILYYIFTFIVMVILLNILIALYGQAYSDITENAIDEYLALFAHKTLNFVRAPDENVFLPPFNLVEMFGLVLPFEWWLSDERYAKLNDCVMFVLYSPFMLVIAWMESSEARMIAANRARGEADDDRTEEWEELAGEIGDEQEEAWEKKVKETVPDVEEDRCSQLVRALMLEVKELREIVEKGKEREVEQTEGEGDTE